MIGWGELHPAPSSQDVPSLCLTNPSEWWRVAGGGRGPFPPTVRNLDKMRCWSIFLSGRVLLHRDHPSIHRDLSVDLDTFGEHPFVFPSVLAGRGGQEKREAHSE